MNYQRPCEYPVSDDWAGHKNRPTPSAEPGTDYAAPYGTPLAIAGEGTVSVIDLSMDGGEGMRLSVDLDDGRRVSYLHLSGISAHIGQRTTKGQLGLMWSGASGYGNPWHYGPHVHVSLWERPGMAYADTIDFELYAGDPDLIQEAMMASLIITHVNEGDPADPRNGITLVTLSQVHHLSPEEHSFLTVWQTQSGKTLDSLCEGFVTGGNPRAYDLAALMFGPGDTAPPWSEEARPAAEEPTATSTQHPLVTPAWVGTGALILLGLVEFIRLVIDRVFL